MFAGHERQHALSAPAYDALVYQHPDLSRNERYGDINLSPIERDPVGGGRDTTLHEAQASYFGLFEGGAKPRTLSSILADAGYENDLPTLWRLVAILAIMLFGVIGFAILVNVVEGISRLY